MEYKIKDISLADFGRKEIEIAEKEMPGLLAIRKKYSGEKPLKGARITGSLHMTIQTAVLIETLKELGADVRWAVCNIFYSGPCCSSYCPGNTCFCLERETLEDYWWCELDAVFPGGKGPNLIVDDGGDASSCPLGYKAEKDPSAEKKSCKQGREGHTYTARSADGTR